MSLVSDPAPVDSAVCLCLYCAAPVPPGRAFCAACESFTTAGGSDTVELETPNRDWCVWGIGGAR